MGAGCCSNDKDGSRALAAVKDDDAVPGAPAADDVCPDDDTCCKDDDCADDFDSLLSLDLRCCTTNEEACDEKCILAVAALECEKSCDDDLAHHACPRRRRQAPASACADHLTKAFETYAAYLETARCICRNILDRGFTSTCCDTHKKKDAAAAAVAAAVAGPGQEKSAAAYASGRSTSHGLLSRRSRHHHHPKSSGVRSRRAHARIADSEDLDYRDLEKAAGLEHVSVAVDGMTCSGCANKVERALGNMPAVSRARVNFVMGHAEFAVDPASPASPTSSATSKEHRVQLRAAGQRRADHRRPLLRRARQGPRRPRYPRRGPNRHRQQKVVQITYDPAVIGARTLLAKIHALSDGLAPPAADPTLSSGKKRLYDALVKTVAAALLTIPVVVLAWSETPVSEKTKAIVSLVLATLVQLIAVPVFYRPALTILFRERTLEMDMLVTISITAAYVYSLVAFAFRMADRPLETAEFFETSTLLVTLVLLGRLLSAVARVRAVAAVSLRSLQAATALLVENGEETEVDARLLHFGDRFLVQPHSRIPTDGRIVHGVGEVDESMLTGRASPSPRSPATTSSPAPSTGPPPPRPRHPPPRPQHRHRHCPARRGGRGLKPKIQDLADRVAGWFVPAVAIVALAVTVIWIVVGLKVRNQPASKAVSDAVTYAIAVLAVSCPCALGLAVPMVLVVAGGIAARGGVIIKSAECTATARRITDVVFDKTGTLTDGKLEALVAGNNHPVSLAIAKHLEKNPAPAATLTTSPRSVPGAGVEATDAQGSTVRAGNPRWTGNDAAPAVVSHSTAGMTLLLVTRDSVPIALFALRTSLRPEAASVVAALQARNISVHLVSGDQTEAVHATASSVGIPLANAAAQRSPAQKRDYVAALMAEPGRSVLFCGDGTNDAVAVAQANIGVQLSGGQGEAISASDVTRGAADVVLLSGLHGVTFLLDVSAAAFRRIAFNFIWSANPPAYAGLGEIVSVLPVIFAAMTMLALKHRI
ncbi:unnamed protein product [Parascedosporium putredinis]|uniref:HMA domain-containing protein n=1 Tax=Parascedosporium putredinis TaxID=1442378 RepID=A0A9P1M901_9PEZI|nr:unnamed protein product [Parascedosporium putredinis]CAI7989906.1 unnamed protein product [Parascedosporium putredinis]